MNYKQKLGYMALGAGILALGITIGQLITPNIEAQQNGVFNEITCRQLTVVDQNGKTAIGLNSNELGNGIGIYDQNGIKAIGLNSDWLGNAISISVQNEKMEIGKMGIGKTAIWLSSKESGSFISISDPNGKKSFDFNAYTVRNELSVHNKSDGAGIGFYADSNEARQTTWIPEQEE